VEPVLQLTFAGVDDLGMDREGLFAPMVLVVDDEPELRAVTARMLREGGYYVLEASSGPDALHQLLADASDTALLVTDAFMPEMSGEELAREVHSLRPGVGVLLMSGRAREAGAGRVDEVLAMPFDEDQLLSAARRALQRATAA
jgi:CheY-like chemotaxis protein